MFRKCVLTTVTAICVIGAASSVGAQEAFPSKPIEVVTHAGAGGGTDVTTRMMLLRTRRVLKQDMIVVNKRGGGGTAAMNFVLKRPADGYTVLAFTIGHVAQMALGKPKMLMDDLVPLVRATDDPHLHGQLQERAIHDAAGVHRILEEQHGLLRHDPRGQHR